MKRLLVIAAALSLVGCSSALKSLNQRSSLNTGAGPFAFQYAEGDQDGLAKVETAVQHASPKLSRWGGIREQVNVRIMPTHELLEDAVNRDGYAWLRAWAKYDEIFVQTPRTWSLIGASQSDVDELLLHELTHCVMYQASGTRTNWTRKQIPLWFREGMASYTAKQGYRWPSLEELARYYEEDPGRDPVVAPESLYQKDNDIVYGAAHHAFTFLARRYGEDRVRQVLAKMGNGAKFPDAFKDAIGISVDAFTGEFKRFVRLRGFRGGRLLHPVTPLLKPELAPKLQLTPPPGQPEFTPDAQLTEPSEGDRPGCHYP